MLYSVAEVLEMVEHEPDPEMKALILRENKSGALLAVLAGALDYRVRWQLPPGPVRYNPAPPTGLEAIFHSPKMFRGLAKFVVGGDPEYANLSQETRERLFILFLEAVDPKDAVVLLAMKDKRLPYPSVTPGLVNAAYPGFLAGVQPDTLQKPQGSPQAPKRVTPVVDTAKEATPAKKRGRGRPKGSKNKGATKVVEKRPYQPEPVLFEPVVESLDLGGGEVLPPSPDDARILHQALGVRPLAKEPQELWLGGGGTAEKDE